MTATRRACPAAALAAVLLLLGGCASGGETGRQAGTSSAATSVAASAYDPAAVSEVYPPAAGTAESASPVPVVLVVPGGGWTTADRTGTTALSQKLAAAGFFAVNASYRAGADGATFPVPVQDVLCAAGYAVAAARSAGFTPGLLVLVGHSAGGHLVALAGTSASALAGTCSDPVPAVDGVVGLAGVYDTAAFSAYLTDFFGVPRNADPKLWQSGDPIHYVDAGAAPRALRVLLIHGDADTVVPLAQSQTFATALTGAGLSVTTDVVPGATHMDVIAPRIAAAPIVAWIRHLT